jgi:hypothetical protein
MTAKVARAIQQKHIVHRHGHPHQFPRGALTQRVAAKTPMAGRRRRQQPVRATSCAQVCEHGRPATVTCLGAFATDRAVSGRPTVLPRWRRSVPTRSPSRTQPSLTRSSPKDTNSGHVLQFRRHAGRRGGRAGAPSRRRSTVIGRRGQGPANRDALTLCQTVRGGRLPGPDQEKSGADVADDRADFAALLLEGRGDLGASAGQAGAEAPRVISGQDKP